MSTDAHIDTYIVAGRRTPLGKLNGRLRSCEAHHLGAAAIAPLLADAVQAECDISRVILANTTAAGNVARLAALAAGVPPSVPALTINAQCTGGLTAIAMGVDAIRAGSASLVIAGGTDSVSQSTVSLGGQHAQEAGRNRPRVRHAPSPFPDPDMGPAADATASRFSISREEQDSYALESYRRTIDAREAGFFSPLMASVETNGCAVDRDELPRRTPLEERLRRYPAAFSPEGSVTVGNAGPVADGAAAVLLTDAKSVLPRVARVASHAAAAADPAYPPLAIVPAIERVLSSAGLSPGDIDLWEINEAFAAKVVLASRHFELNRERVNVHGGAIAYGHAFAASGAILLVHLVEALGASGARYGLAAIAGAGGLGEAMIVERC